MLMGHSSGYLITVSGIAFAKPLLLWLSNAAAVVVGSIELVERRNRSHPLDPARQIAIGTLLESMPEAIFLLDSNGHVIEANLSAERLTAIPKGQLTQMGAEDIAKYVSDGGVASE